MLYLIITLCLLSFSQATPLYATFSSCLSDYSPLGSSASMLNVTDIYASIVRGDEAAVLELTGDGNTVLRANLIGKVGEEVVGYDNGTNKLATLFTQTTTGGINVFSSTTWLCNSIFPPNLPEPYFPYNVTYCPIPAGDFALNLSIPLYRSYALTTLKTRIRIVDTASTANTISCTDVNFTPYQKTGWYYELFLWLPVVLAIGFWAATWGARFAAGWVVGSGVASYDTKDGRIRMVRTAGKKEATMRKWGTMFVSGLSGERLSVSGGLLRFVTPGLRDVIYHIQWCTILGMIAVSWPGFAYPILAQGAWADLVGNTTLVQSSHTGNLLVSDYPNNYTAPTAFADMMNNPYYPLYLDSSAYNPLLDLHGASNGMQSWATAVGLRDQDLFGTCLVVFLMLAGGVIILSLLVWVIHGMSEYLTAGRNRPTSVTAHQSRTSLGSSPRHSLGGKEAYDRSSYGFDGVSLPTQTILATQQPRGPSRMRRTWLRFRPKGEAGAFHAAALYGNLLRLILLFHLPITTFSVYQLTLSDGSIVSRVFAALALVFISVLVPAYVMLKISRTPSGKLFDATRTLLSLGPLYNVYIEGKQMFRIFPLVASLVTGVVVGAGQRSGIAQAVILVLVELAMLIVPAVWYPWGEGASMGAPSVLLGVLRVASMVMVMILSPTLNMTASTNDWLAYAILLLQAIAFLFFLFMLLTKTVEGLIRLFGGVHFDESTHQLDGGLFAAIMDLDCLNGVRGGKAAARKRRERGSRQLQRNVSAAGSLTTQMMLDKYSQGVQRDSEPDGKTPYMSPFPPMNQASGYFPESDLQPPLGPPPLERHSSESKPEESSAGHIMDAWSPPVAPPTGYAPLGGYTPSMGSPTTEAGPSRSFSVVRGGRADYQNPYDVKGQAQRSQSPPVVRISQPGGQSMPTYSRTRSALAIIDAYNSPPGSPLTDGTPILYPPGHHQGARPNKDGFLPAPLAIPKRRSLNNLKNDPSPESEHSHETKGKRKSKEWFGVKAKPTGDDSESDDEPGPARRRPIDRSPLGEKKGWRSALGLGGNKSQDDLAQQAKDENKARKAALAAESGSLFAGVDTPPLSGAKKGFVVKRKGPVQFAPTASGDPDSARSFRVRRMGSKTPEPISVDITNHSAAASQQNSGTARSFKVIRPNMPSPSSGSFIVNRSTPNSTPPGATTPSGDMGYPPTSFVPLASAPRASTDSVRSGEAPVRPSKNPRRSSRELSGDF